MTGRARSGLGALAQAAAVPATALGVAAVLRIVHAAAGARAGQAQKAAAHYRRRGDTDRLGLARRGYAGHLTQLAALAGTAVDDRARGGLFGAADLLGVGNGFTDPAPDGGDEQRQKREGPQSQRERRQPD